MIDGGDTAPGRVRTHLSIPLFRNAYALVVTTALTSVLGVGYWALAAHYYRKADVGRASATVALLMLLAGITQLNLINGLPRFLPRAGSRSRRLVVGAYGATTAAAIVVVGGFVALGGADKEMAVGHSSPWPLRLVFVAAVVGWNLFTLQDSVLAGLREAVWVPVENALFSVAKIVLLVAVASALPRIGPFVSWTIPAVVAVIPVNILIFHRLLPRHVETTREAESMPGRAALTRFLAGDYLAGLFQLSSVNMLPLLVVHLVGLTAAAYFSTAWIVAGAFDLVLANIGVSLTVEGAIDQDRLPHLARSVARLSAAIAIPAAVVVALGAPFMLDVLGSEYRHGGAGVLRFFALAMPFRAVTVLYLSLARVRRRVRQLLAVQAASCLLVLGSAIALLPHHGITVAAGGYLVTQVIMAAMVLPSVVRTLRAHPPAHPPTGPTDEVDPDDPEGSFAAATALLAAVDQAAR